MTQTHAATFGDLLKQLRKRSGMTQGDLAAAVGYSVSFVSVLEQNRRLPDVDAVLQVFVPALGLLDEPHLATRLVELAASARGERPPVAITRQRETQIVVTEARGERATHLPAAPTDLIGRAQEVRQLCQRLPGHSGRLLTLVGPPGIGKTQLALAVAAHMQYHYPDGAAFVALAAVSDAVVMATTIAASVECSDASPTPPKTKLIAWLRSKTMLLVLDNLEQIRDAAPLIADLLAECPGLCVLATSRERLHLRAEQRFQVPPLDLAPAIALFIQRAQVVNADFSLTPQNQPTLAAICQRLDRLPLALELCAAQIDLLVPAQLLAQLHDRRLDLLVEGAHDLPPRQRTLRTAIQHSYRLLDEAERTLLRRLGVFVGGFDVPAVAAVVAGSLAIAVRPLTATLHALIGKSLVRAETTPSGEQRFVMLETIREYALEQLDMSGEAEAVRRQHAAYFLALAEAAAPQLQGAQQRECLERLAREYDNLRAALEFCLSSESRESRTQEQGTESREQRPDGEWRAADGRQQTTDCNTLSLPHLVTLSEVGLRLAGALWLFWYYRGHIEEGHAWLDRALAATEAWPGAHEAPEARPNLVRLKYRAKALYGAAMFAWQRGDWATMHRYLEEILTTAPAADGERALALAALAWLDFWEGDRAAGHARSEEALMLLHAGGADWDRAWGIRWLAHARQFHDGKAFYTLMQESLALFLTTGDRYGLARSLHWVGNAAYLRGDFTRAAACLEEGLALNQAIGDHSGYGGVLSTLGRLAAARGEFQRAIELATESLARSRELGNRWGCSEMLDFLGYVAWARGDYDQAVRQLAAGLALARELDNKMLIGWPCNWLAWVACVQGEHDQALARFEENLALARADGITILVAWSLQGLAYLAWLREEHVRAVGLLEESLVHLEAVGWILDRAFMLSNLARAVQSQGDLARAAELWRESLALSRDLGERLNTAIALEGLAGMAVVGRRPERAARLYGAAAARREAIGAPLWPSLHAEYNRSVAAARAKCDPVAFDVAWAAGQALPLEQAIAEALGASRINDGSRLDAKESSL